MPDSQTFEMRMELKGDDSVQTAIIQFEVSGQDVVKVRGLNKEGEEKYRVSLVVSQIEPLGGGCWICLEPPCPPNSPTWFDPCPIDPPAPA